MVQSWLLAQGHGSVCWCKILKYNKVENERPPVRVAFFRFMRK